jgi:pimeloyl-ACP methyl ester carboxylesterase
MNSRNKQIRSLIKIVVVLSLLALNWPMAAHSADPPAPPPAIDIPAGCTLGSLPADPQDQLILTCMPDDFNGTLVVYAHGYVSPQEPLALPLEEIQNFVPIIEVVLNSGFAFATSSYSKNGYAIEQAGEDLNALVAYFKQSVAPPDSVKKVLITGASEGGVIAAMLVEKFPKIYAGGLALCGPLGGMPTQIKYLGDFRVVFDYFFADVIPLDGIYDFTINDDVPIALPDWENAAGGGIKAAIRAAVADPLNKKKVSQLFKVTGVSADPDHPQKAAEAAVDLLKFSVLGTQDILETTDPETTDGNGRPFGNLSRRYRGSKDDRALNAGVERVESNAVGRRYVRDFYDTTGNLKRPLVTLHTTDDPLVPFKHELIYALKVAHEGRSSKLVSIPVFRDGHCEFKVDEVLGALVVLLLMTM